MARMGTMWDEYGLREMYGWNDAYPQFVLRTGIWGCINGVGKRMSTRTLKLPAGVVTQLPNTTLH